MGPFATVCRRGKTFDIREKKESKSINLAGGRGVSTPAGVFEHQVSVRNTIPVL